MMEFTRHILFALPVTGTAIFFLAGPSCNNIPDAVTVTDTTLTYFEPDAIYRTEFFHLFDPTQSGDSTDFRGTVICSLWVNGSLDSVSRDSLYGRIRHDKDTVACLDDSVRGVPGITVEDIASWKTIGYHLSGVSSSLMAWLFKNGVDSSLLSEIKQCLDTMKSPASRPPESIAKAVLNVFTTAASDIEFFYKNRDTLLLNLNSELISPRIRRLVSEGIFLDSAGKPKPNAGIYEKTAIQWFNMEILSSLTFDPQPPADIGQKIFPVYFTRERLHKFSFMQGSAPDTLDSRSCFRLIAFDKSGESLIFCSEKYADGTTREISRFGEKRVLPFPYITGTHWSVAPLFWTDIPLIPSEKVPEMVQPGRAISTYKMHLSTVQDACFDLTLCYPINGSLGRDTEGARYIGHSTVRFRYCRSFASPFRPGTITEWNTEVYVRRTDSHGHVTAVKEISLLNGSLSNRSANTAAGGSP